ncbi:MAG: ABC transporter permease subunit [Nitrososphaerota archaeon]|jgi:ABC-type Na+ efflux pump permease subunit|nr:ABC transporter permease subunit [Nitrososphaerota archaeon]
MNIHKAWLVFKKDWLEIKRNWQVLLPIIILPLIFAVVFPLIISVLSTMPADEMNAGNFQIPLSLLPIDTQTLIEQMTQAQLLVYVLALYIFAPMFLIIPIMTSSVLASDSFAGERERKTIEALLATPISDSELFLGKILVSFIPAMIVTVASFATYTIILDIATIGLFNGMLLLPNLTWLIMILGVAPTLALCSIGLTVLISAKVKGFKEAQQISALLLFPVLGLMFAQISGILILGPTILVALIAIFVTLDAAIFYVGIKIFQREEILSKM